MDHGCTARVFAVSTAESDNLTAEQAFERVFWPVYPRKTAKYLARTAWNRLKLADDDQATLDAIMAGLQHYIRSEWRLSEPQYIPHPATWINQRRWEDLL